MTLYTTDAFLLKQALLLKQAFIRSQQVLKTIATFSLKKLTTKKLIASKIYIYTYIYVCVCVCHYNASLFR